jgi:GNAT superfamily N-acetyltransferase
VDEKRLIESACDAVFGFSALGSDAFEAHDAWFTVSHVAPSRHDANHVGLIRTKDDDEMRLLLSRAEAEYRHSGGPRFDTDAFTPPQFVAYLLLQGFAGSDALYLVLEDDLTASPRPCDIREVGTEDDWQAYIALDLLWWQHMPWTRDPEVVRQNYAYERLKMPSCRYWMAYVEGTPRAFLTSWVSGAGMGFLEYIFTQEEFRHRGLATALLAHCVADVRARGAGPVLIGADPSETAKAMFASLGFRPLMVNRTYSKASD